MCPHTKGCQLFPVFTLKGMLKIWQTNYCESDFAACARYQRSAAGLPVPFNMLPNGKLLAGSGPKK